MFQSEFERKKKTPLKPFQKDENIFVKPMPIGLDSFTKGDQLAANWDQEGYLASQGKKIKHIKVCLIKTHG